VTLKRFEGGFYHGLLSLLDGPSGDETVAAADLARTDVALPHLSPRTSLIFMGGVDSRRSPHYGGKSIDRSLQVVKMKEGAECPPKKRPPTRIDGKLRSS
jgi:hypothetical protein